MEFIKRNWVNCLGLAVAIVIVVLYYHFTHARAGH
jgi:hypothetical protein